MANYGYLPNVQRLQLKACGVQSVVDLDKAAERAEAMGVDIYIPGLPAAEEAETMAAKEVSRRTRKAGIEKTRRTGRQGGGASQADPVKSQINGIRYQYTYGAAE